MTRVVLTLLFLTSISLSYGQSDNGEEVEKKIIQDKYVSFLTGKGYEPKVDEDGDVKFTYNDKFYYITIDMNEKEFFRIALLATLELDSEEEITRVKSICHEVTKEEKVAKVYWISNTIWTSSEIILKDSGDYMGIFDRVLSLTESAYESFLELWKAS